MKIVQIGLLLFAFCIGEFAFAQRSEVGLNFGGGGTLLEFPGQEGGGFAQLGLSYYRKPPHAFFTYVASLNYAAKIGNGISLHYLRVPLGLDIEIGKKFQFVFGGGVYTSVLISENGLNNDEAWNETKNVLQFGVFGNLGFAYQINEVYNIGLRANLNFDITPMYEDDVRGRWFGNEGLVYSQEDIKGMDGVISLILKRRIGQ